MEAENQYYTTWIKTEITVEEMQALKHIRNYFGQNDKTQLEHLAYDVLDRIIKRIDDEK